MRIPRIAASRWGESGSNFTVKAELDKVITKHGPGVYTVALFGYLEGDDRVVSKYSIFHEVTPPRIYSEKPGNSRPSAQYAATARGRPH